MSYKNIDLEIALNLIIKDAQSGKLDIAFKAIERLSLSDGNNPQVWQLYGLIASLREDFDEACRAFCRSLSLAPFNRQPYLDLATIHQISNKMELARGCLKSAFVLEPSNEEIRQRYSQFLISEGDVDEAQSIMGEKLPFVVVVDEKSWAEISRLNEINHYEVLLRFGERLLSQNINDPRVNYLMAVAYQNFNGTEEVILALRLVVAAMPAFAWAQKCLADYLIQKAVLKQMTGLQLDEIFRDRASSSATDALAEAKATYEISLEYDRFEPDTHTYYGNLLCRLGDYPQSAEQYRAAKNLNPDNSVVRYNLASLLFKMGDFATALDEVDDALQLETGFSEAHKLRGQILAKLGDVFGSGRSFLAAVQLGPKFSNEAYF